MPFEMRLSGCAKVLLGRQSSIAFSIFIAVLLTHCFTMSLPMSSMNNTRTAEAILRQTRLGLLCRNGYLKGKRPAGGLNIRSNASQEGSYRLSGTLDY